MTAAVVAGSSAWFLLKRNDRCKSSRNEEALLQHKSDPVGRAALHSATSKTAPQLNWSPDNERLSLDSPFHRRALAASSAAAQKRGAGDHLRLPDQSIMQ